MSILRTLSAWGACSILACGAAMAQQPATPPAESLEVQQQAPAPAESETAATPTEAADCAESACETSSGSLIIVDRRGWRNRGLVYGPLDCTDGMHGKHGSTTTSGHFRHYGRAGVIRKGEAATPSGTTWTRHHGAQVSGCYSVTRGGAIYRYNQKAPVTDTTPRDIVRARQQWLIRSGPSSRLESSGNQRYPGPLAQPSRRSFLSRARSSKSIRRRWPARMPSSRHVPSKRNPPGNTHPQRPSMIPNGPS